MTEDTVLAGDLGGTHTRLATFTPGATEPLFERHYRTDNFSGLLPMLQAFLAEIPSPAPRRACIAVAGPVHTAGDEQQARITRQQWDIDSAELRHHLPLERLRLVNDFEAVGHAVAAVPPGQLHTLQAGNPAAAGNRAVIGAGTGLGQALLFAEAGGFRVVPTEGGHADFAPQGQQQLALLHHLEQRYPHVSYDRVVSGPGLVMIYEFLAMQRDTTPGIDTGATDAAARIGATAMADSNSLEHQAVQLFLQLYGAQAGNLALASMATGGIYLAGGIAPKLLPLFAEGTFLDAFTAKGRMAELMATIPVHVILTPQVGLLGAAQIAGRL